MSEIRKYRRAEKYESWSDGRLLTEEQREERRAQNRAYYVKNRERVIASTKKWHAANPERRKAILDNWKARNRQRLREEWVQWKYGMSPEAYQVLWDQQNGKCAICLRGEIELCVDHNHITGRVRGLLCQKCNLGVAPFDDVAVLYRAIAYLEPPEN